jgi:hypothetical protein
VQLESSERHLIGTELEQPVNPRNLADWPYA